MNVLIIAPHPDDEVLGCGGVIAKLSAQKNDVYVGVITSGISQLSAQQIETEKKVATEANQLLGVKKTFFCDLPAAELDTIAHRKTNEAIVTLLRNTEPDILFVPFLGDIHLDHQHVFNSALVAARPIQKKYPKKIYAYETLSETNWNAAYLTPGFHPNVFFDISSYLDLKLRAFEIYKSEVKQFPHERSLETLKALATLRGSTVHLPAAEAFVLIREVG